MKLPFEINYWTSVSNKLTFYLSRLDKKCFIEISKSTMTGPEWSNRGSIMLPIEVLPQLVAFLAKIPKLLTLL